MQTQLKRTFADAAKSTDNTRVVIQFHGEGLAEQSVLAKMCVSVAHTCSPILK